MEVRGRSSSSDAAARGGCAGCGGRRSGGGLLGRGSRLRKVRRRLRWLGDDAYSAGWRCRTENCAAASETPPQDHPRLHLDLHVSSAAAQMAEAARPVAIALNASTGTAIPTTRTSSCLRHRRQSLLHRRPQPRARLTSHTRRGSCSTCSAWLLPCHSRLRLFSPLYSFTPKTRGWPLKQALRPALVHPTQYDRAADAAVPVSQYSVMLSTMLSRVRPPTGSSSNEREVEIL